MAELKTTIKGKIEIPVDLEFELIPGSSKENSIVVKTKLKSMTLGDPNIVFDDEKEEETYYGLASYTFVPEFGEPRIIVGSTVYLTEEDLKNMYYTKR